MNVDLLNEFEQELSNILGYWSTVPIDIGNGGFYGQVENDNRVVEGADKGSVLNARILWFFSAAYNYSRLPEDLELAKRAYGYFSHYFIDREHGGVYWSIDAKGNPKDSKKQVYAIAFAIYGLAEYYKASHDKNALSLAINLYADLEKHSYDSIKQGYFEAFSQDWSPLEDQRLSDKDANEKKTMNTHLHLLEAFTNLYGVWPDDGLRRQLEKLLAIFGHRIIDQSTHHLKLFFDENWRSKSEVISFGHDIEASWLLLEAAEIIGDELLVDQFAKIAVQMVDAAIKGFDGNGGMNYEMENGHLNGEKHWWVQAEALVGLYNAYQLTGKKGYMERFDHCWAFVKKSLIDHQHGEWFWGVDRNNAPMPGQYKVGLWKCPYHNGRACLELIRRMSIQTDVFVLQNAKNVL
ncbi:AGE family epimerase/isomerase [Pedobacter sp.]|uniref:AGE family epimerase/isomerase n=1 Tax=Pedobacter sp. TaxID=1411316 RepID=UPI0031E3460A